MLSWWLGCVVGSPGIQLKTGSAYWACKIMDAVVLRLISVRALMDVGSIKMTISCDVYSIFSLRA